jgi:abequosyltransferase
MNAVAPKLSICTPTHDGRARTLLYGLEEIIKQASGNLSSQVEVCISDNASSDGTEELVHGLSARSPIPISYRRNRVDLGLGPNILQAIDMARGDYCWLMSSDDALADGALERILQLLAEHPGIAGVSVACRVYDADLDQSLPTPTDRFPSGDRPRVIEGLGEIVEELGSHFIGISLHIVQRNAWLVGARSYRSSQLVDGLVPHIVFLVGAAHVQPRWLWCPEPLIKWRSTTTITGGLEGFMAGILDHLALSLSAYLSPRDPAYRRAIAKFAKTTLAPRGLRTMAVMPTHSRRGRRELTRVLVRRLYWLPRFWLSMAPSMLLPPVWIKAVRKALRLTRAALPAR